MANQELIDEIKIQLAEGKDTEVIKTELRTRGFPNDDIDSAFIEMRNNSDTGPGFELTKREVFIGIAALLVLAACVYAVMSYDKIVGVVAGIAK